MRQSLSEQNLSSPEPSATAPSIPPKTSGSSATNAGSGPFFSLHPSHGGQNDRMPSMYLSTTNPDASHSPRTSSLAGSQHSAAILLALQQQNAAHLTASTSSSSNLVHPAIRGGHRVVDLNSLPPTYFQPKTHYRKQWVLI